MFCKSTRKIRKVSLPEDGERLLEVFAAAKGIMVADGNASQWTDGYPSLEIVQADIEKDGGFVVEDDGKIVIRSSDWSSDVCSSDLENSGLFRISALARTDIRQDL